MQNAVQNRFTVFFGIRNPSNTAIAPALEAMGLPMLRQEIGLAQIYSIPDLNQPGYGLYKTSLPHFINAYYHKRPVNLLTPGISLPSVTWESLQSFGLPNVAFGWSISIPSESLDQLRERDGATDVSGQGRPGLLIESPSLDNIHNVRATHPDLTFPPPYGATNLSTIPTAVTSIRIMNLFAALQQYPAFMDTEHYENFIEYRGRGAADDAEVLPSATESEGIIDRVITPEGVFVVQTRVKQAFTSFKTDSFIPYDKYDCCWATNPSSIGGLWFPYIAELALYDTETVPRVVDLYFKGSFGEDSREIIGMMMRFRADWGLLGKTEWGKAMSHVFTCMKIAIEGQGVIKFHIEEGRYLGSVVQGSNFTVSVNKQDYRPGTFEQLKDAVNMSGSNQLILGNIGAMVRGKSGRIVDLSEVKGMWELRCKIWESFVSVESQGEIIKLAGQLRLPKSHWKMSVQGFEKAAARLTDGTPVKDYGEEEDLPITASALFTQDKPFLIWSCFGPIAPSFRIPGGQPFDLTKSQNIVTRRAGAFGKGGKAEMIVVSRLSMRMVALEMAVEDLKTMMREKTVLNPFGAPNTRRSTANQYKMFTGADFQRVVGSLRTIAGVGAAEGQASGSGKGKRRAGGEPEDMPGAKRSVLDWDF